MIRFRNFLPLLGAALVGAAVLGASAPARADFIIRVTDSVSGDGTFSDTQTVATTYPGGIGSANLSFTVHNVTVAFVNDITTTGNNKTNTTQTFNISYNGP